MKIFIIVMIIAFTLIALILYSACIVANKCTKIEELKEMEDLFGK